MDTKNRGRNDYSLNEKSYLKKSRKIMSKVEESRSKSNPKLHGSRNISPVYDRNFNEKAKRDTSTHNDSYNYNLVDGKRYLEMKKESGGILTTTTTKNKSINDKSFSNNHNNYSNLSNTSNSGHQHSKNSFHQKSQSGNFNFNYLNKQKNSNSQNIPYSEKTTTNKISQQPTNENYHSANKNNKSKDKNINMNNSSTNNSVHYNYIENNKYYKNEKSRDVSGNKSVKYNNMNSSNSSNKNYMMNQSNVDYLSEYYDNMTHHTSHLNSNKNQNYINPKWAQNRNEKSNNSKTPTRSKDYLGSNDREYNDYILYQEFMKKNSNVRNKTPIGLLINDQKEDRDLSRPKSNNIQLMISQTNIPTNSFKSQNDSVYTHYKKNINNSKSAHKDSLDSSVISYVSNIKNSNPQSVAEKENDFNFHKTFGKSSEISSTLNKLDKERNKQYHNYQTENILNVSRTQNEIRTRNESRTQSDSRTQNESRIQTENRIILTDPRLQNESRLPNESRLQNEIRVQTEIYQGKVPTNSSSKNFKKNESKCELDNTHHSYSQINHNFPSESNISKDTFDSNKFKLTNTHSSVRTHSIEDMKNMTNKKIEVEEVHFAFIYILQNSKRALRIQEEKSDIDELFTTVTKCDERDL